MHTLHMDIVVAASGETFATQATFMWKLPCVGRHVFLQVVTPGEGHVTFPAVVRFVTCVRSHVHLQYGLIYTSIRTLCTLHLFLC